MSKDKTISTAVRQQSVASSNLPLINQDIASSKPEHKGGYSKDYTLVERMTMHRPTWQGTPAPITIAVSPFLVHKLPEFVRDKYDELRGKPKLNPDGTPVKTKRQIIDDIVAEGRAREAAERRAQRAAEESYVELE